MIGLDTNLLVRYFAQDDLKQSAIANRIMGSLSKTEPGFISLIVLCELIWVLEDLYGLKKREITKIVQTLLQSDELVIESKRVAWQAFNLYSKESLDLSDALIARLGLEAGCHHTFTFDKQAAKSDGFLLAR